MFLRGELEMLVV